MYLYEGQAGAASEAVKKAAAKAQSEGKKAGIIDFNGDIDKAAREFFKELHRCDHENVDVIYAAGVRDEGLGIAVMDRMRKAAGNNIIVL